MDEAALLEPLVADQEGFDIPFDEALLKELAALDAAEAGGADAQPPQHVEDEDVYKMKELIRCAQIRSCSCCYQAADAALAHTKAAGASQSMLTGFQGKAQGCDPVPGRRGRGQAGGI
jgi:hypothetical protein